MHLHFELAGGEKGNNARSTAQPSGVCSPPDVIFTVAALVFGLSACEFRAAAVKKTVDLPNGLLSNGSRKSVEPSGSDLDQLPLLAEAGSTEGLLVRASMTEAARTWGVNLHPLKHIPKNGGRIGNCLGALTF